MAQGSRNVLEFEAPIQELEQKIEELRNFSQSTQVDLSDQIEKLLERCNEKKRAIFAKLSPWQKVLTARHPKRPLTSDYVGLMVEDLVELYGDRSFRDDPSILTGFGRLGGERVCIVGQRKGKDTAEKVACYFGCPHPEGYRKALLKMKLAEKFGLPIVTLINTPGAYPGIGAEERGQAFVIARNLMEMARLRVPVVCAVIGEGGSGGALGIGVGNRVLMLEHSYYSVISPEGCSAILWKSAEHKDRAAEILKLTAEDLLGFGVIDEIVPEPLGGAHRDPARAAASLKEALLRHLRELLPLSADELVRDRYERLRRLGIFREEAARQLVGAGLSPQECAPSLLGREHPP
ncbi:MAG: acetyl-CoA carboxylase carboxyltransferase subunit alpha [Planctomycetes bacterium]|nr:acetyl-CoA carboxylase carboxyltransferase subunit alpha [Planctomycetota bacterium]